MVESLTFAATKEDCRKLGEGITVAFPEGFPNFAKAGGKKLLKVKITVADRKLTDPYSSIPVSFSVSNGLTGSKGIFKFLTIKKIKKDVVWVGMKLKIERVTVHTVIGCSSSGPSRYSFKTLFN